MGKGPGKGKQRGRRFRMQRARSAHNMRKALTVGEPAPVVVRRVTPEEAREMVRLARERRTAG